MLRARCSLVSNGSKPLAQRPITESLAGILSIWTLVLITTSYEVPVHTMATPLVAFQPIFEKHRLRAGHQVLHAKRPEVGSCSM